MGYDVTERNSIGVFARRHEAAAACVLSITETHVNMCQHQWQNVRLYIGELISLVWTDLWNPSWQCCVCRVMPMRGRFSSQLTRLKYLVTTTTSNIL